MKSHALLAGLGLLATASLRAQDSEFSVNNFFRAVSTALHPITQRNLPYSPNMPASYLSSPGVPAGTRAWTFTPQLRAQAGSEGGNYLTITGFTQAIHVGAAVVNFPAPNHYQFRTGIAPAVAHTTPPLFIHAPTGADLLTVADQPIVATAGGILEHSVSLTTPTPIGEVPLLLYVEFRGGEWQDDTNGGQTYAIDWQGGGGPSGLPYFGVVTPGPTRTNTFVGLNIYRPKIGLLVREAVATVTGHHANQYYQPLLAGEDYRGLAACIPDWSSRAAGTDMFFDIRAGSAYGSGGSAIMFMNIAPTSFPGRIPLPYGNLMLNPADPAFSLLAGIVLTLGPMGEHNGESAPIQIPPLGSVAIGTIVKVQGVVFNPGLRDLKFTTAAGAQIQ